MKCSLPPHKEPFTFTSYGEYEAHYIKFHTHRCLECQKNMPSEHLLSVHIEECHDPLVVVRRDKGEHTVCLTPPNILFEGTDQLTRMQYSCFVEGCERKCLTHHKRRMHMIDKHMYPKNYFFAVTKEGIDGRNSLLKEPGHGRRRSSTSFQNKESRRRQSLQGSSTKAGKEEELKGAEASKDEDQSEERPDAEMDDLSGAMSSLQMVPPSIRFGRGRKGFAKR